MIRVPTPLPRPVVRFRVPFSAALLTVLAVFFVPGVLLAACPSDDLIAATADGFLNKKAVPGYGPGLTVEDAYCAQGKYVALIGKHLGPRIGYKIAFAGKRAQEQFGVSEPARGVLLRSMILSSGVTVDPKFGVRGLFEPDLLVTIKDSGINQAATPLEAARHLDQVVAFYELPDVIIAEGQTLNGANIIAINTGARSGVTGTGVKVQPTQEFVDAFARMEAVLIDDSGKERSRTKGESLMGNPLNALLWLAGNLKKSGLELRPGDMISLGAMGAIVPPEPGRSFTLRYEGLPGGTPEVVVTFTK